MSSCQQANQQASRNQRNKKRTTNVRRKRNHFRYKLVNDGRLKINILFILLAVEKTEPKFFTCIYFFSYAPFSRNEKSKIQNTRGFFETNNLKPGPCNKDELTQLKLLYRNLDLLITVRVFRSAPLWK